MDPPGETTYCLWSSPIAIERPAEDSRYIIGTRRVHMSSFHAVVWLDHETAHVITLHADGFETHPVMAHHHNTRQHASGVRTQHEFFGAVCDAVAGVNEVLVLGSHTVIADCRHYVKKHRPALVKQIAGWEISDRLSDGQLAALGRQFFEKHDRMAGFSATAQDSP